MSSFRAMHAVMPPSIHIARYPLYPASMFANHGISVILETKMDSSSILKMLCDLSLGADNVEVRDNFAGARTVFTEKTRDDMVADLRRRVNMMMFTNYSSTEAFFA